jgi:hypothetical protein
LGYADTVYRAQNVAVEGNSYVLEGGPGGAPTSVYTGLGLARGTTYLFQDSMESDRRTGRLREKQAAHTVERLAAAERAAELERQRRQEQAQRRGHEMSL